MKPPILVFVSFGIALATASASASTTPEPHHLQPNAPRSVTVTEAETPPVTRCHPGVGEILFQKETISPLVAFYHSAEKMAGHGTKAIYVCLPPDEWGDKLPIRSSFKHIYPKELQKSVVRKWQEYGFSS